MISSYKCTLGLKEGKGTSVTLKQMSSQREQYESTVHLFIGTGLGFRVYVKLHPCPLHLLMTL
jgi:hypothetical protein